MSNRCRNRLEAEAYEAAVAYGNANPLEVHYARAKTILEPAPPSAPSIVGDGSDRLAASGPHQQPLIEPLTRRELEVLHLMAAGLTNQQIADELVIALGTVKSYTSYIYGKLDVTHRTQAVAHARAIGLLP